MAIGVVDGLEVVDVEHHQPDLGTEAAASLDLAVERVVEVADVRETGELVGHRLHTNHLVQVDVLDRDRGLPGEVAEEVKLAVVEVGALASDRHDADLLDRAAAAEPSHQRYSQRVDLADGRAHRPALRRLVAVLALAVARGFEHSEPVVAVVGVDLERAPLRRLEGRGELRGLLADPRLLHPAQVQRERPPYVGLTGLDCRPHRDVDHLLAVEAGGERLTHAPDRVLQLAALALDLLDLRGQLLGHVVELVAERRELVRPLHGHRPAEVPAREAPGRVEELVHLALERPHDDDRGEQRENQERAEDRADQRAAVGDRAGDVGAVLEHAEPDRRAERVPQVTEAAAEAAAADPDVSRVDRSRRPGLGDRRADDLAAHGHPRLESRHAVHLVGQRARSRDRHGYVAEPAAARVGSADRRCHRRRRTRARERPARKADHTDRADRRHLRGEGPDPPRQCGGVVPCERGTEERIAGDAGELSLRFRSVGVVDRESGAEALCDSGIRLAGLAVRGDAEHDQRHRDHRDDHDDHEEQQQPAAKAHVGRLI